MVSKSRLKIASLKPKGSPSTTMYMNSYVKKPHPSKATWEVHFVGQKPNTALSAYMCQYQNCTKAPQNQYVLVGTADKNLANIIWSVQSFSGKDMISYKFIFYEILQSRVDTWIRRCPSQQIELKNLLVFKQTNRPPNNVHYKMYKDTLYFKKGKILIQEQHSDRHWKTQAASPAFQR